MFATNNKNTTRKIGRKRGSAANDPEHISPSTQGAVNRINIDVTIAIAPAALLGNAFSIA